MVETGMNAGPLVTVVICTYNRANLVRRCLEALDRQDISPETFAVVVVDNRSTDATRQAVERHAQTAAYALRWVMEENQGTSHARNRGARESATPWLAFLDDDVRPHGDWMRSILDFITDHPDAAMFGGPYLPDYLDPPPAWLPAEVGRVWHGDATVLLPHRKHFLVGGNFMARRDIFLTLDGFDPNLGPCGDVFQYGEDTEFYRRAISLGYSVYHTPRPVVDHLVRLEKYRLAWHITSLREFGANLGRRLGAPLCLFSALGLTVCAPLLALINFCIFMDVPVLRRVYFALHPLCYAWGLWAQLARLLFQRRPAPAA